MPDTGFLEIKNLMPTSSGQVIYKNPLSKPRLILQLPDSENITKNEQCFTE